MGYSIFEKKLKNGVNIVSSVTFEGVILIITLLCFTALFSIMLYVIYRHHKKMEEISIYSINVNAKIDGTIPEILDLIINESFTDYKIKCLLPLEENYINSKREAEIRQGLTALVSNRISSSALDKLRLFYNTEHIAEIMADKIYICVMNYVISHNRKFSENE